MDSAKHKSLAAVTHGAQIALLNDPANTAQALWLLERAGELTFKPGVDPWAATKRTTARGSLEFDGVVDGRPLWGDDP